jgi:hypothetical protein
MRVIADFAYGCSRLEDRRPTVARQYVASVGAGAILKRIIRFLAQGLGRGLNNSVFQYGKLFVESLRAKCLTSSLTLKVYTDPSTSLLWWQCTVKGADLLGLKQTRVLSTNNYGVLSVVVCTPCCERGSMSSILIEYPT